MSEQLGEPAEVNFEEVQKSKLEKMRNIEQILQNFMQNGRELALKRFTSVEDAEAASKENQAGCGGAFRENFPLLRQLTLVARGEGVREASVTTPVVSEETSTISFSIGQDDFYTPLTDEYDQREFLFHSLSFGLGQNDDDSWSVQPYINGLLAAPDIVEVSSPFGSSVPLFRLVSQKALLIPCNETSATITVQALEKEELKDEAIDALRRIVDDSDRKLLNGIQAVRAAMLHEHPTDLRPFKDMKTLRAIGKGSIAYALRSANATEVVDAAVAAALGEGRTMVLDGKGYERRGGVISGEMYLSGVSGTMIGAVSHVEVDGQEKLIGSTVVLQAQSNETGTPSSVYYMPLAEAQSLQY